VYIQKFAEFNDYELILEVIFIAQMCRSGWSVGILVLATFAGIPYGRRSIGQIVYLHSLPIRADGVAEAVSLSSTAGSKACAKSVWISAARSGERRIVAPGRERTRGCGL